MRVFIVGAKSQALLSYQILLARGDTAPFVFDEDTSLTPPWDCVLINDDSDIERCARECEGFLVCIGNIGRGEARLKYARRLEVLGLMSVSAIHPTTFIAATAKIGHGLQTFPCSVIGEFATIGDYCIVGINAAIDHETSIGNGCHVMGGAAVAGLVTLKDCSDVGANATILPRVSIGSHSVVGAGAVVVKDVPDRVVVAGVPAKVIRPN
jgi:sugar O-acyltransferase (sialic acid O-acetyltransferase NeuD family)